MIYREYLVMRNALPWFAGLVLALMLIVPASDVGAISYAGIANGAGWLAVIFASIFGVALGNGSREPARVLWVLPARRWILALQVIGVDLAGTTVAFACVYLFMLTFAALHFRVTLSGTFNASNIAMALATTYGAYGWSALAGMLGRRIAYGGLFALPALMLWMIFAGSKSPLGAMLRAPIAANPFAVYNAGLTLNGAVAFSLQWLYSAWATPMLSAIAIATCGLAVAFWQRAEVIN